MHFRMPNHPCDVEVPDSWLREAGVVGLKVSSTAFRSGPAARLVPLTGILPPHRVPSVTKDWRGMDRARFISILKGIAAGAEMEPVRGRALAMEEFPPAAYSYRVIDGYHRFYASVVVGFSELPMLVLDGP